MTASRERPFILGLTGSIGMGKSAVAAMFSGLGVPVFDADAAVHELQGAGGLLLPAIEAAFPGTTGPGGVDRAKLGAAVFGNSEALGRLESIVHPAVAAMRKDFLRDHSGKPLIVFDIPLLFEKGGSEQVDAVLVVSASPEARARTGVGPTGHDQGKVRAHSETAGSRCGEARARRLRHRYRHFAGRDAPCRAAPDA